jgi:hypothetical protein
VSLIREPKLELQIVNHGGSVHLPKGEWAMSLVLADIYGNEQAVHFTVYVVDDSVEYQGCRLDSTVLKQPFSLDHIYVIGSLWRHKIHIPLPRTQDLLDCSS